jgi:hypothetical protein
MGFTMIRSIILLLIVLPLAFAAASDWDLVRVRAPNDPQTLTTTGFQLFHRAGDFWIGSAPKEANLPPGSQTLPGYEPDYGELFQVVFVDPSESAKVTGKVHLLYSNGYEAIFQANPQQLQSLTEIQGEWILITTTPKFIGYTGVVVEQTDEFHPLVEELVAAVSLERYVEYLQILEDFRTRNTFTINCDSAAFWIFDQFQSFGLDASFHEFNISGHTKYNVVGELPGVIFPDSVVFVTGHYDATVGLVWYPEPIAPGTDDDGSGTAYVLESARVLSQYQFENTIRFVAFAGEEQGMVGSLVYVGDLVGSELHVVGDFNLDMVGYAGEDPWPPDFHIYADGNPLSLAMAQKVEEAIYTFLPGALEPRVEVDPAMYGSDHVSFWTRGLPAIWGIESVPWGYDFNPYYHTVYDLVVNCSREFAVNCTKVTLAALADYAGPFVEQSNYLALIDHRISEITGNGNNIPDPDELISIEATLHNFGTLPASNITATLECTSPFITINQDFTTFPDLDPGESGAGSQNFELHISSNCPQDHWIITELYITASGGYENSCVIVFWVSPPFYEVTGPDAYGYLAFDYHDHPEFPVYEWIEICADSGGPGTRVPFTLNDQTFVNDLPFTFGYYGTNFDRYTVAANGWIGMGEILQDHQYNYPIPNLAGPPAIIAPYDQTNNRLVVEYNQIELATVSGSYETFQIILEDPSFNPYSLGDGRIRFQYKDISDDFYTGGTVGIEDPTETMGLQYFYNAVHDSNATPITDKFVILFTPPEDPTGVAAKPDFLKPSTFQLIGAYPNPFNPTNNIRFDLPIASQVTLNVFDINGRRINVGVQHAAPFNSGRHHITFDGSALASGIYIYRLTAGEFTASGKMVLMK